MSALHNQSDTHNRATGARQGQGTLPPPIQRRTTVTQPHNPPQSHASAQLAAPVPRTPSPDQRESTSRSTSVRTSRRSPSLTTSVGSPEETHILLDALPFPFEQHPADRDDNEDWKDPAFVKQQYASLYAEVEMLANRLRQITGPADQLSTLPPDLTADMTAHFAETCEGIRRDMLKAFREELREQLNGSLAESIVPLSISIETVERSQNRLQNEFSKLNGTIGRVNVEVSQVRSEVSKVRAEVSQGAAQVHEYAAEVRQVMARYQEVGAEMLRIRAFAQAQDVILDDYDRHLQDIQQCLGFQSDDVGEAEVVTGSGPSSLAPATRPVPAIESILTSPAKSASTSVVPPTQARIAQSTTRVQSGAVVQDPATAESVLAGQPDSDAVPTQNTQNALERVAFDVLRSAHKLWRFAKVRRL